MTINYDHIRYGRDSRYGILRAPNEEEGSVKSVWWLAFPTAEDRTKYAGDLKSSGDHMDFLSEREIACAIGVKSRKELWDYFDFTDPEVATSFLKDRRMGIYGKADPLAKAPTNGDATE